MAPPPPLLPPAPPAAAPVLSPADAALSMALAEWDRLRRSDTLGFEPYANFLLAHPGWPGEARLRKLAEAAADPARVAPARIASYFARIPAQTATGRSRHAEALAQLGRMAEAGAMARQAWVAGNMASADEARLTARFASLFTLSDHDQRMERLLAQRASSAATRQLALTSPLRRAMFDARLALQLGQPDAAARADALGDAALVDPGFLLDKARWLRDSGSPDAARALLARPLAATLLPVDPSLWVDTLLVHARDATPEQKLALALNADRAFAPGTDISSFAFALRDDYTSLVWIGAQAALKSLGRPLDAQALFDRYAAAARTPQTQTRGWYWAGRAALAAGDRASAERHFTQAAAHPDQFYGQLAAERLGTSALPAQLITHAPPSASERSAFAGRELVRAARLLGQRGQWRDQSLFVRAIAAEVDSDAQQALAVELATTLGRPDLGVMVARNHRNSGGAELIRFGFPALDLPVATPRQWTLVHAIARQESQFDREIMSAVGAAGLMQLMPATAQETATKLGLPYDRTRLTADPAYNVTLGSAFFARLLDSFGGNHVLAIAAYNAGPGNVRKWIAANGDPRQPGVDMIDWIEAIPFGETRGYVQRVLENAVIYDQINPGGATMPGAHRLSAWLGKDQPG